MEDTHKIARNEVVESSGHLPTALFEMPLQRGDYGDDICDDRGKLVANLYGDERNPKTVAQRDYVIRAVNSYDDMLAALKAMVADDAFADLCQGIGHEPEWLKSARLAIAKAGAQ